MSEEIKAKLDLNGMKNLENYITNLQKDIDNLDDFNRHLLNENKQLKELNVCVGCKNNPNYKQRCEKAIEYIKQKTQEVDFDNDRLINVLNILQGGDE